MIEFMIESVLTWIFDLRNGWARLKNRIRA